MCAGRQGLFWGVHDRLFADQAHLDQSDLEARAAALGVDQALWRACLDSADVRALIDRESAEADRLGLSGTPSFVIAQLMGDGRARPLDVAAGALSAAEFRSRLDKAESSVKTR